MPYAIIQIKGKQFKVSEGDTITTDRIAELTEGETITISDVLLIADEKTSTVGTPTVAGAEVKLEVLEHAKGEKILVFKFKSKSRYRKTNGHRQLQTYLKVVSIKA